MLFVNSRFILTTGSYLACIGTTPFGLLCAPYIFNQLADALEWILLNKCFISYVGHIVDDFLIMEPPAKIGTLSSMLLTNYMWFSKPHHHVRLTKGFLTMFTCGKPFLSTEMGEDCLLLNTFSPCRCFRYPWLRGGGGGGRSLRISGSRTHSCLIKLLTQKNISIDWQEFCAIVVASYI